MKGIMFELRMSKAILMRLHLVGKYSTLKYRKNWPIPERTYQNQLLVKTVLGGICPTDLHMASLNMSAFASIMANPMNPSPMGHELVGEVITTGDRVALFTEGDRVVYFPAFTCEIMGFQLCASCQRGNFGNCYCLAGVGDGSDLEKQYGGKGGFGGVGGGGFCEYLVGFEKQFFKVPQNISDEVAVLTEPFAVGIHAVSRNFPSDDQTVVVIGAGTIGLMVVAALRTLGSACKTVTIARYPFQAEAAKRLGADEVILEPDRDRMYERVVEITGGRLFKPIIGKRGVFGDLGPDMIFDSIGTETSLDDALHLIRGNGKVVIIGQAYAKTKKVDWSIQTWKEVEIAGSFMYGMEPYRGRKIHCFELALQLLQKNQDLFNGILTHTFPIDKYRSAFSCVQNKSKSHALKAAFDYR